MGATNKFLFCYLPTLLLLGSVFFILSIHQQKCHNIDCHFNCMNTGSKTVLECIHECKCMLAALPFWLTHFPPAFEPFQVSQVSKSECTGETASTPKLAQLPSDKQPFKKKPNFVVVLLDDQDEVISPYFDAMPFAKQLFQTNGTKFENSFASTALCCPARCQLLTGLYAHNTGVYANVGEYGARRGFVEPLDEAGHRLKDENGKCINHEKRTIAAMLRQNGNYATGIFGKYLNGIEYGGDWYLPPGWSDFSAGGDHGLYTGYYYSLYNYREGQKEDVSFSWYNFGPEDYMTDVVRDRTVDFIHRYRFNVTEDNKRPLFMYVSSTAPHFPLPPAERHKQYLDYWDKKYESIVTSRPNFYNDSDVATKSAWLRNTAALRKTWREHPFLRTDFVKRMASLYSVDEMIQSIHEKLKQQGELDNTVWVLTSDNGYNLGSHHLIHKMAPYEESTRIPFYVSGPGFPKGKVSKDLVLIQDITPTLLNLAGYETPSYMDGFSLVPGKGNSSTVEIPNKRNAVLFEYKAPISWYYNVTLPMEIFPLFRANYDPGFALDIPPYKAIRTKDHMLVDYFYFEPNVREATRHEFELYDMKQDPYQLNNIYKKVGGDNSSLVQELYGKMQKLRYCKGKECNI